MKHFYIESRCAICGQGHLAFRLCSDKKTIVIKCEECLTVYFDPGEIDGDKSVSPDRRTGDIQCIGTSVTAPGSRWAVEDEVRRAGWGAYVFGAYDPDIWSMKRKLIKKEWNRQRKAGQDVSRYHPPVWPICDMHFFLNGFCRACSSGRVGFAFSEEQEGMVFLCDQCDTMWVSSEELSIKSAILLSEQCSSKGISTSSMKERGLRWASYEEISDLGLLNQIGGARSRTLVRQIHLNLPRESRPGFHRYYFLRDLCQVCLHGRIAFRTCDDTETVVYRCVQCERVWWSPADLSEESALDPDSESGLIPGSDLSVRSPWSYWTPQWELLERDLEHLVAGTCDPQQEAERAALRKIASSRVQEGRLDRR